jgi:lysophospholipase L1-like esterase
MARLRLAPACARQRAGLGLALLCALGGLPWPAQGAWVAAWIAAPQNLTRMPPTPGLHAERLTLEGTVRQRVVPVLDGERLRVRFSNLFGKRALRIAAATVARSTGADGIAPATLQPLRFAGSASVEVAPGQVVWSDAAPLPVRAGEAVAVSFELPRETPITTVHRLPLEATWIAPGAWTTAPRLDGAQRSPYNYFVTGLDVDAPLDSRAMVAFGDSITEGAGADGAADPARYPERLAARLRATVGLGAGIAVVNAGIGGNRLLADGAGTSALERFDRDALGQSGVSHVLILIGINDIGFGTINGVVPDVPMQTLPNAAQLATGLQSLVQRARARGVKVLLGTLTPMQGAGYWAPANEAKREALNAWIRSRQVPQDVDGVVDFDAALRDPAHPLALDPRYDGGDHLHPNAAGTQAMADAVDLHLLGR